MNTLVRIPGALALVASLVGLGSCGPRPSSSPTALTIPAPADEAAMTWSSPIIPLSVRAPSPPPPAMQPIAVTEATRTARLLAGLDAQAQWLDQAEAARLARSGARLDDDFAHFGRTVGEPMERWAAEVLEHEDGETIFYPFAGPDFVTAHRLYPRAGRYVLVAMQKAGPPPPLAELPAEDRSTTFELHRQIVHNFTRLGFFVTKEMNERYHRELPSAGLTGTLMAFAEREGLAVIDVEPITLDEQGEVVPHPGDRARAATWSSVRLHLRRRADGREVTLDYLRLNLGDWSLRKHEAQRRFVQLMSGHRTLLKAASHLLQQRHGFSVVREALLDNAPSILQDETGLPYDALARGHDVQLYGEYEAPHRLFDADPQAPLAEAYAASGDEVQALPFRIGYRKRAGSCLQYAVRDASEG
ncbi:MAG: hypothetical protein KDK70_13185 [Myxococcales bacterium]|nr:hypothetical protein [Myxococcales bacterium]